MSSSFLQAIAVRTADATTIAAAANAFAELDLTDAEAPAPPTMPPHPDLEQIAQAIADAPPRSVIVMVGAGASVSAGIPDFRTPGTGLYDNLQKYNLPYAEAVFDISYFRKNPSPFYTLCAEMWPGDRFEPTAAHRFFKALHDHEKLLRVFTQNIDSLESQAGLPADKIVAAHGNFDKAHVVAHDEPTSADGSVETERRRVVDAEEAKLAICGGEAGWRRMNAKYGGLVKPAASMLRPSNFYWLTRSLPHVYAC